jgi:hypothetical protein
VRGRRGSESAFEDGGSLFLFERKVKAMLYNGGALSMKLGGGDFGEHGRFGLRNKSGDFFDDKAS